MTFLWAKGSRKRHLNVVVIRTFEKCQELQIKLLVEWIPRKSDQFADYLSKLHDSDDWMLNSRFFRMLDVKWGSFTFDRFASARKAQCSGLTVASGALVLLELMPLPMTGVKRTTG